MRKRVEGCLRGEVLRRQGQANETSIVKHFIWGCSLLFCGGAEKDTRGRVLSTMSGLASDENVHVLVVRDRWARRRLLGPPSPDWLH